MQVLKEVGWGEDAYRSFAGDVILGQNPKTPKNDFFLCWAGWDEPLLVQLDPFFPLPRGTQVTQTQVFNPPGLPSCLFRRRRQVFSIFSIVFNGEKRISNSKSTRIWVSLQPKQDRNLANGR